MNIPVPVYVGIVVVLLLGYGVFSWRRARAATAGGRDGYGVQFPEYLRDHQIQERWFVHAFLAYYTGTGGDPAYSLTRQQNIDNLTNSWGLRDAAALRELVGTYERGECTLAFDLIRVIKLMREGYGAGLLSEQESWDRAVQAAQRLHSKYRSWDDVYSDFQSGRDMWWREVLGRQAPPGEFDTYAERYGQAQRFVIQGRQLH
jgi:hypothetical protein